MNLFSFLRDMRITTETEVKGTVGFESIAWILNFTQAKEKQHKKVRSFTLYRAFQSFSQFFLVLICSHASCDKCSRPSSTRAQETFSLASMSILNA